MPLQTIAVVVELWQSTWLLMALTVGVGFTVMVELELLPTQVTPALVKEGITPTVAVNGVEPGLVAGKGAILPVPLLPNPMEVFELVQA